MLEPVAFTESKGVNFARYKINEGEYAFIADGFAMKVAGWVFLIDGYLRIDGVLVVEDVL